MDVLPLTKVDMTHIPIGDWRYAFLGFHGFRVKIHGARLFMVRSSSKQEIVADAAIAHLDRIAALHRRTLLCRRLVQFPRSRRSTQ